MESDLEVLELTERVEPGLEFRPMLAGDALLLEMQDSQHFELGLHHSHFTFEQGEDLADTPGSLAWAAVRGSRIVAIAGFRATHRGQAIAWAALSGRVGKDHLAITRYARAQLAAATDIFHRIECLVEADNEAAVTWAEMLGLKLGYRLRKYGAEARDHFLFERVKP